MGSNHHLHGPSLLISGEEKASVVSTRVLMLLLSVNVLIGVLGAFVPYDLVCGTDEEQHGLCPTC